jgi:hypothetical protein
MSKTKTKQTTAVATAGEPIVVNGIEFTPKMIEDLTTLATLESSVKGDKKAAEKIKNVFKPFTEENEAALRGDWVRVGNLRVKLEVTRTLKVEIVD